MTRYASYRKPKHKGGHQGKLDKHERATGNVGTGRARDRDCANYEGCLADAIAHAKHGNPSCVCHWPCGRFEPIVSRAVGGMSSPMGDIE